MQDTQKSIWILLLIALLVIIAALSISFMTDQPGTTATSAQFTNEASTSNSSRIVVLNDYFAAPEYELGGGLIALAVSLGAFGLYWKYKR